MNNYNNKTLEEQYEHESEMFPMWLLFESVPERPCTEILYKKITERFGPADITADTEDVSGFGIKRYSGHFDENSIPAQVILTGVQKFELSMISDEELKQVRDIEDPEKFLKKCSFRIVAADMKAMISPAERTELLMDWLDIVISLMPECVGVWIPTAGKLISADSVRSGDTDREDRFICRCINVRYFTIKNKNEMLSDTHGMHALGLPDVQCHFTSPLLPEDITNYLYNVSSFIIYSGEKISDGDTLDGLKNGVPDPDEQWQCRYEDSMVGPMRAVIDICPGKYAAGTRE